MQKDYGSGICIVCYKEFVKYSPSSLTCGPLCRRTNRLKKAAEFHEQYADYERNYRRKNRHALENARLERRKRIRDLWGRYQDWTEAENIATTILANNGYNGICLLAALDNSLPFDIVAFKDNEQFFFQVSTSIDIQKNRPNQLAKVLRFKHYAIFISLTNKKYIIKPLSIDGGQTELNETEVKNALTY